MFINLIALWHILIYVKYYKDLQREYTQEEGSERKNGDNRLRNPITLKESLNDLAALSLKPITRGGNVLCPLFSDRRSTAGNPCIQSYRQTNLNLVFSISRLRLSRTVSRHTRQASKGTPSAGAPSWLSGYYN